MVLLPIRALRKIRLLPAMLLGALTLTALARAANAPAFTDANWTALSSGTGDFVFALAVSGSNLFAGGGFKTAGGSAATNIAKWNGNSWSAVGSGLNSSVYALAVLDTDVYAGGLFTMAGGTSVNRVAKWNGSSWSALGSGMNAQVNALAISGSDIYAGGVFETAGGSPANGIAKWNGNSWTALGSGVGGARPYVYALAASGGELYAGGEFTMAGGTVASRIAKWNGSSWSALGSGISHFNATSVFPPYVAALAVSGSDVYAAGVFTAADGRAANRIAKWNGSSWSALGLGLDGNVYSLAVSGGDVYAGGGFMTATNTGGATVGATNIAKWNGSVWSALGSGIDRYLYAMAVASSDLFAGGAFTTAGAKISFHTARAYLLPLPELSILRSGPKVIVSWPSADTASFALEHADTLVAAASWVTNTTPVADDGTRKSATLPATNGPQFFRLRRP